MILMEGTYDECMEKEESYINRYDTFHKGLNLTDKGKGRSETNKFSTFGYRFSEESKRKMSESQKNRKDRNRGFKHSEKTKKHWSKIRKGRIFGPVKINKEMILSEWKKFNPPITEVISCLGVVKDGDSLKFKNGRLFTYNKGKLAIFRREQSDKWGVTKEAISRIIKHEYTI